MKREEIEIRHEQVYPINQETLSKEKEGNDLILIIFRKRWKGMENRSIDNRHC